MTDPDPGLVILCRDPGGRIARLSPNRLDELHHVADREGALTWISVTTPSEETIAALAREFHLHPLALEDVRKRGQRPKIDTYEGGHVIVAYEAPPDATSDLSEIHILVGPSWLVSMHWTSTPMVDAVRERFADHAEGMRGATGEVLYELLDAAVDSFFPHLDRISDRIDSLEDRILAGDIGRDTLAEILHLKRRLLDLRRVVAPMRDVANSLLRRELPIVDDASIPYYQDLYDHLVRVLDQLDLYRDLLAAVLDARLTVASNSLNAIMKRLTAFTVVLMLPTLIAGVYGMNFRFMPELDWPIGYPFALGLMLGSAAIAVTWFRRNDWF
jgi:magnesium transporter